MIVALPVLALSVYSFLLTNELDEQEESTNTAIV
jgi:hypothetical protein